MNVPPIIIRELRVEARRSINYMLRTMGAGISTIVFCLFLSVDPFIKSGGPLFSSVSLFVFLGIWFVVPVLAADCLSREKREGTLGLLFLTRLKPVEIVLSKGVIHAVRSLAVILAAIPILASAFVLGGITTTDFLCSIILNLTAVCSGLAAAFLASSLANQRTQAVVLAELFSVAIALGLVKLAWVSGAGSQSGGATIWSLFNAQRIPAIGPGFPPPNGSLVIPAILLAASVLIMAGAVFFSAFRIKHCWNEDPRPALGFGFRRITSMPGFFHAWLGRRHSARRARNPVLWLQQRSWGAWLSTWGWCVVVVAIGGCLLVIEPTLFPFSLIWLTTALLISMSFSAVGSFQQEKRNGILELILVAPLREREIIMGRLWGIWLQFLPAITLILLARLFFPTRDSSSYTRSLDRDFLPLINFILVPIVGLYFGMRLKSFLAGWLLTAGLMLFLPLFLTGLARGALLGFIATLTGILLFFDLKNRTYVLHQ